MMLSLLASALLAQVVDMNATTVNSCLAGEGRCFVLFKIESCMYCKSFGPVWQHAALKLMDESGLTVGRVDGNEDRFTTRRMQIQKYPSAIFFADGKMHRYTGPKSADEIAAFAKGGYKEVPAETVLPALVFAPAYMLMTIIDEVGPTVMARWQQCVVSRGADSCQAIVTYSAGQW